MPRKVIPCVCEYCGADFFVFPCDVLRGQGHYCGQACYHASRKVDPEIRFWRFVQKTETCWLWTGGKHQFGYGAFARKRGHLVGAHCYSWELHFGPIPAGMFVLHNCPGGNDNPACVNPAHLWLGTQKDNVADCAAKGRRRGGTPARLTADQVRDIRARYAAGGVMQWELAAEFAVSRSLIGLIILRKNWRHVP
jgi:Pectobacterium phage endonuclease